MRERRTDEKDINKLNHAAQTLRDAAYKLEAIAANGQYTIKEMQVVRTNILHVVRTAIDDYTLGHAPAVVRTAIDDYALGHAPAIRHY